MPGTHCFLWITKLLKLLKLQIPSIENNTLRFAIRLQINQIITLTMTAEKTRRKRQFTQKYFRQIQDVTRLNAKHKKSNT